MGADGCLGEPPDPVRVLPVALSLPRTIQCGIVEMPRDGVVARRTIAAVKKVCPAGFIQETPASRESTRHRGNSGCDNNA